MAVTWQVDDLDLDAYLARVGLTRPGRPSRSALDALHAAHVRTFPFENFDVLLGTHPGVDLATVQDKFVRRHRGGYCFEHGTLLAAVLERLGYDVERRLARVGDFDISARTHLVVVVTLNGTRYLADPGFGLSLMTPIPIEDGAEITHEFGRFRLRRHPGPEVGWSLERDHRGGWEPMHTCDETPARPADVQVSHHFTSTHPSSHFRTGIRFTRAVPGAHTSLSSDAIAVRRPGEATAYRHAEPTEILETAYDLGARLTPKERATLLANWPTG